MKIQNIFNKIRSKKEFKDSIYNIKLIEGEEGKVLNEKGDIVLIAAFGKGTINLDSKKGVYNNSINSANGRLPYFI